MSMFAHAQRFFNQAFRLDRDSSPDRQGLPDLDSWDHPLWNLPIELGPDAEVDPEHWPSWTDADHFAIPAGPTRRSYLGGMLAVVGLGAAGSVAVAASEYRPLTRAWERYLSLRPATARAVAWGKRLPGGCCPESEAQEEALLHAWQAEDGAEAELARMIARAAGFDAEAYCAAIDDPYSILHDKPLASVREGSLLFLLLIGETGTYFVSNRSIDGKHECCLRVAVVDLATIGGGQ